MDTAILEKENFTDVENTPLYLFVCTGNTCRSPMAEGLAKKMFPKYDFSSAGLFVNPTDSVSKNSVLAMKNYGIDITKHINKNTRFKTKIAPNKLIIHKLHSLP